MGSLYKYITREGEELFKLKDAAGVRTDGDKLAMNMLRLEMRAGFLLKAAEPAAVTQEERGDWKAHRGQEQLLLARSIRRVLGSSAWLPAGFG